MNDQNQHFSRSSVRKDDDCSQAKGEYVPKGSDARGKRKEFALILFSGRMLPDIHAIQRCSPGSITNHRVLGPPPFGQMRVVQPAKRVQGAQRDKRPVSTKERPERQHFGVFTFRMSDEG